MIKLSYLDRCFSPLFKTAILCGVTGLAALAGCNDRPANKQTPQSSAPEADALDIDALAKPPVYKFDLINTQNKVIGEAKLTQLAAGQVMLRVKASDIPPGPHGIHFHVTGKCAAPDFKSAGGHINMDGRAHGLENPDGPDNADMPNAVADSAGVIDEIKLNERVSLFGGFNLPALFDADGSALVIHQNPDDQITQPIGGAGPRIACAELRRP